MQLSPSEKLTVARLVMKFPAFYELNVYYRVKKQAIHSYSEPHESNPQTRLKFYYYPF
jgi:hypothetical protein